MPSAPKKHEAKKWESLGFPISRKNISNPTYSYPQRTEFDSNTGTYKAHPTYHNDKAARDREAAKISGKDYAYPKDDPKHSTSRNHAPRIHDPDARSREKERIAGRDFGYSTKSERHHNSKVGK